MRRSAEFLPIVLALGAMISAPRDGAQAQAQGPYQVYDSRGTLIGQLLSDYEVIHKYNGQPYSLYLYQGSLIADAVFYFASANCSGQPYLFGQFPNEVALIPTAVYQEASFPGSSGKIIWTADTSAPAKLNTFNSFWYQELNAATNQVSGFCETFGTFSVLTQPAIPLDTKGFVPPFCVGTPRCNSRGDEGD